MRAMEPEIGDFNNLSSRRYLYSIPYGLAHVTTHYECLFSVIKPLAYFKRSLCPTLAQR